MNSIVFNLNLAHAKAKAIKDILFSQDMFVITRQGDRLHFNRAMQTQGVIAAIQNWTESENPVVGLLLAHGIVNSQMRKDAEKATKKRRGRKPKAGGQIVVAAESPKIKRTRRTKAEMAAYRAAQAKLEVKKGRRTVKKLTTKKGN